MIHHVSRLFEFVIVASVLEFVIVASVRQRVVLLCCHTNSHKNLFLEIPSMSEIT